MTDLELLRRFRTGDRSAFKSLLDRHEASLLRYASRLTGDRELAEDIVQEAFLALVRGSRNGLKLDSPTAWLFRVTRNRAKDMLKKETRMKERHNAVAACESVAPAPCALEEKEKSRALRQQFARLKPPIQEVLALKIQEGKSYREIAAITGFSLGKISSLVHRGLDELAETLRAAGLV